MKKLLTFLAPIGIFFVTMLRAEPQENPFIVILLGPPGAGKGTYAVSLKNDLGLPHISTGDLFRDNLRNETPIGKKAKEYMDKGQLVPDEIVIDMLFQRISQEDCKKGFILDGFPRTLAQAKALDLRLPKSSNIAAINLLIDDKFLVERITGRIMCKTCGAPYHKKFHPPKKENVCDKCGGELYQRKDDTEAVVKERLDVYHKQTEPLIAYFKEKKILHDIDSSKSIDEVYAVLLDTLKKLKK